MDDTFDFIRSISESILEHYDDVVSDVLCGKTNKVIIDFGLLENEAQEKLKTDYMKWLNTTTSIDDALRGAVNAKAIELKMLRVVPKYIPHVQFSNVSPKLSIREIGSEHVNGLIQLNGIVISTTPPHSIIIQAAYGCERCGEIILLNQLSNELTKPSQCTTCNSRRGFVLNESETKWDDYQEITIQENPEEVKMGVVPRTIRARMRGEHLLDVVKAGDLVDISCSLVPVPVRGKGRVFSWCLDINYINVLNKEAYNVELSDDDIEEILAISHLPNLPDVFRESIFPSIYGHDKIKDSLVLGMFGAPDQKRRDITQRGTINILMVGDPSTGKTRMLQTITNVAPKAIYASGKGASGVGLTAAAVQDQMGWRLEAGALVLASGGICCIDEIEKISTEDRDKILEAMSVQTISINKANIHTTLRARTVVIAAANPVDGRYRESEFISDNISLPPTILSRFDLIFIVRDIPDEKIDTEIARRVFDLVEKGEETVLDYDIIKKYILYSKQIFPKMSPEAIREIMEYYIPLRNKFKEIENSPIAITTRQLEGLKRLSQARARLSLRDIVTIEDAEYAIDLLQTSMKEIMTDPDTGRLDADIIHGKPKSKTDREYAVLTVLRNMMDSVDIDTLEEQVAPLGINRNDLDRILLKLQSKQGANVWSPRPGMWQAV